MTVSTKATPLSLGSSSSGNSGILPRSFLQFYGPIWTILWRKKWQPTPVFLPEKYHGQRSLVGYNPQGHKTVEYDLATKQWACLQIVVLVREQESLEVPFLWLSLKHSGFGLSSDILIANWRKILQWLIVTTTTASPLMVSPNVSGVKRVWLPWTPLVCASCCSQGRYLSGDQENWIWRAFQPVLSETSYPSTWMCGTPCRGKTLIFSQRWRRHTSCLKVNLEDTFSIMEYDLKLK